MHKKELVFLLLLAIVSILLLNLVVADNIRKYKWPDMFYYYEMADKSMKVDNEFIVQPYI